MRILIVDDDVDFSAAVSLSLEAAGYEVVSAHSAAEAKELLPGRRFDVAILDMMMEEPDAGAIVANSLRKQPELRDTPVILITSVTEKTGYRMNEHTRERLGVDEWMDKPVDPVELLHKIEALTDV